ncbi:MAG: hypothetical protein E7656_07420 [Ruminococcaceae bacterium]|nr:hypothetical protein [Oscillospiraceae bacterium]
MLIFSFVFSYIFGRLPYENEKEEPVNCKKFNVGPKTAEHETKSNIPTSQKIGSVCQIEIKPQEMPKHTETKNCNRKQKPTFLAVCCALFCLTAILGYMIPMPKELEKLLVSLSSVITEPAERNTVLITDVEPEKAASTTTIFAPAASDSRATEENNNIFAEKEKAQFPTNLSTGAISTISNETQYDIDISEILATKYPIEKTECAKPSDDAVSVFADGIQSPSVLIIHTHGTEGYTDSAAGNYRTHDKEKNVVTVGKHLAQKLTEKGISVVHCEKMFDESSYIKAYSNSFAAVSEYLAEYPSIKYVIDLHRDAIPDRDGDGYARLLANIDGVECAQLMFVVGTDEAGATHPNWRNNLRTVFEIQKNMCESFPSLMRAVNLRRASFNQQLSRGYFILEAGNCENELCEVLASMELFADIFAKTITK